MGYPGIISKTIALLESGSATGAAVSWPGNRGVITAEGTWSGATLTLQYQTRNGSWVNVDPTNGVLTANGMFGFELPPGQIRASISGGPPSAMYVYASTTDGPSV